MRQIVTLLLLAVGLTACDFPRESPTGPGPLANLGGDSGARFSPLSEAGREPLSVPNDCPSGPPVITRVGTDSGGFKTDYTFQLPNNTTKAELAVYLVHSDGRVTRDYFAEIVNNDGSVIKGVWDNTFTEAGHRWVEVRRIKCGKATSVSPWSEPYPFYVGQASEAGKSKSCEDQWAEVPGADPEGRCAALQPRG